MASTDYIVLKGGEKQDTLWAVAGRAKASSAAAAIRAHLNGAEEGGTFVAVPARSWAPVSVEVTRAIKFQ